MAPGYLPCLLLSQKFADPAARTGEFYSLDLLTELGGSDGKRAFTERSIALDYAEAEAKARRLPLFEQDAGGSEVLLFDPFTRPMKKV
jgi:hypothetical protein